jgi:hypothetical protein
MEGQYQIMSCAYPVFVYFVSRAGRQVDWLWFESERVCYLC